MALRDPYRNFKFEVEIDGFVRGGFRKVSGLKRSTEVITYREGGENESPRKLTGQTDFDPITLERGKSDDSDFLNWCNEIFDTDRTGGAQGGESYRRTVVVFLKNKAGARVVRWRIRSAWPSEYGTEDLDADGNDVLIDTLVLQNEGIDEERL